MEWNFRESEKKWQQEWADKQVYKTTEDGTKPKYYVLDMFPYPSGAGLHVGHPLGYIASDIISRFKTLKGFNVLHPMGFDAFGLPAEQYAIQTGQHPAVTTAKNLETYKRQLRLIGFNYDWDREVNTSEPEYYRWTQWIFLQLFNSWYNLETKKAEPIQNLIQLFASHGSVGANGFTENDKKFSAEEWAQMSEKEQADILMQYRLAYQSYATVNWCEALGTVLANDEVKDGLSERGGHPVEKKLMRQWFLRITAYAERLLNDLEQLDWSDAMKDMQRNWIGRSQGASLKFELSGEFSLTPNPSPGEMGTRTDEIEVQVPNAEKNTSVVSSLTPNPSPGERGTLTEESDAGNQNALPSNQSQEEKGKSPLYKTAKAPNYQKVKEFAREMRKNPTKTEEVMWEAIRGNKLGFNFRRQHVILNYIADFVCLEKKVVIELDGEIHLQSKEYDAGRDEELLKYGFTVLRFTNAEVENDLSKVLEKVVNACKSIKGIEDATPPSPLERGIGGEASNTKVEDTNPPLERGSGGEVEVFTTRPDTIFGVSFLVLAPEHELVAKITTPEQKQAVEEYVQVAKNRSERERQADVKRISGVFTGAYALHLFTGEKIPVWIGDYVLAGYGTGAVMAVPAGDQRDWDFAKHFGLPIPAINEGVDISEKADPTKEARMINSGFLNGLTGYEAIAAASKAIEDKGIGKGKVQYRLRDAGFSRQRYWGEPFPIVYKNGIAYPLDESELPLQLPEVKSYQPTGAGASPLAGVTDWVNLADGATRETDTMPGYAGSSWYFLRYMDPKNPNRFVGEAAEKYWQDVDVYIGGTEHAVGHLMYARFWQKVLFDLGLVSKNEPFKKLINQGMILGRSNFVYRQKLWISIFGINVNEIVPKHESYYPNLYISLNKAKILLNNSKEYEIKKLQAQIEDEIELICKAAAEDFNLKSNELFDRFGSIQKLHVDVSKVNNDQLNIESFKEAIINGEKSYFLTEDDGSFICDWEIEKMSKSKYNVVNPDDIVNQYGADTLRLYEMFLGPLEQAKPWNTNGIEGVYRFLLKLWRLFHNQAGELHISDEKAHEKELRALHKLIKKVEEDIENFSFNTSVSSFMICVNELSDLKCNKKEILRDLLIVLSPYAPHICEELWYQCGFEGFVVKAQWPKFNEAYLKASTVNYPVSFNGKTRFNIEAAADLAPAEVEKMALTHQDAAKWLDGKLPKKVIVVPGRIVNVVV
jgi:leucyl-tRNA synthetase